MRVGLAPRDGLFACGAPTRNLRRPVRLRWPARPHRLPLLRAARRHDWTRLCAGELLLRGRRFLLDVLLAFLKNLFFCLLESFLYVLGHRLPELNYQMCVWKR